MCIPIPHQCAYNKMLQTRQTQAERTEERAGAESWLWGRREGQCTVECQRLCQAEEESVVVSVGLAAGTAS